MGAPALLIIAGGVSAHDFSRIAYTDGLSFPNQLSDNGYTTVSGNARIMGATSPTRGVTGISPVQ